MTTPQRINIVKEGPMTIKALIKVLKTYNQNAEVRVIVDRQKGDTCPATLIRELNEHAATKFGFAARMIDEEKEKKKTKRVVIG
jgi:hypothetical protein